MKNSFKLIMLSAIAACLSAGCSPKVQPDPEPATPKEQTFNVKAGETAKVEFECEASWTAKSDVEWLTFSPESGKAGANTIECTIGAQMPSFKDASKGILSIEVEGKKYDMTFLREAMTRTTRILDNESKPLEKLVFNANEETLSIEILVEADYYWDLDMTTSPWPVWINNPGRVEGKLSDDGMYRNRFTLTVNEAEAGETDKKAEITFIDLEDESFKTTLPVEFVARVYEDKPFVINSELGTEIHVTPAGRFKDKDGKEISSMYFLNFSVETEDFSEFKMVYWDATAYDTMWHSSTNMNFQYFSTDNDGNPYPKFLSITPSFTDPTNPKAFTLFVAPGAFNHDLLRKYNWNMGYIMFLPKRVWEKYAEYAERREFFTFMFSGGALSYEYKDPEDPQKTVIDSNGALVHEIKPSIRKYAIRIYVDKD